MGRPKAELPLAGRSFALWGLEALRAGGCRPIYLVEGAHRSPEPSAWPGASPLRRVHNPDWPLGPLSSIQAGLRAALRETPDLDAAIVHRVEQPRVRAATIRALITRAEAEPATIWQPRLDGRSGHPLLWPRACFAPLLALDAHIHSARSLLRDPSWSGARRWLEVDELEIGDPGVLDNIDTPEDYAALVRAQSAGEG